jgi:Stress responsive A/B Barrel Domain
MKKIILISVMAIASIMTANAQPASGTKLLRHVVLFGWKAGTDTAAIQKVVNAFRQLPGKISLIKGFEYGVNNSPEGLNQGLSHCFFLTFASEKDRDDYIIHPAHKAFATMEKPGFEKVTVFDYWADK